MYITESGLFEGVTQETINKIGAESIIQSLEKGSTIFKAGEDAHFFYILVAGVIEVSAKQGVDFTVNRPGAVVGLSAIIDPFRHRTSASAKTDIEVVKVPREAIGHVLKKHPEDGVLILRHLMAMMAQRLAEAYEYLP